MVVQIIKDYSKRHPHLALGELHDTNIPDMETWNRIEENTEFEFGSFPEVTYIPKTHVRLVGDTKEQALANIAGEQMELASQIEKAVLAICWHDAETMSATKYCLLTSLDNLDEIIEKIEAWKNYQDKADQVNSPFVCRCAFGSGVSVLHLVENRNMTGMPFWLSNGDNPFYGNGYLDVDDLESSLKRIIEQVLSEEPA